MTEPDAWSYLLITPDGVLSGILDDVLDLLRNNSFDVVAARAHRMDVPTMIGVYSTPPPPPGTPKRKGGGIQIPARMYESLYQAGPACLLVLRRSEGDACATLARCKGYTRPEAAEPGTIRRLGENVILNLVHSPDDPANAWRELCLLTGEPEAVRLRAAALTGPGTAAGLIGLPALAPSMPAATGWAAISFPATANRLRRRVVQLLALRAAPDPLELLGKAQARLDEETDALARCATSLDRMRLAQSVTTVIHEQLTAVVDDPALESGLVALHELYRLDGDRDVAAVLALAEHGVFVSALEKMALETHAVSFRPHEDLTAIYGPAAGRPS
jgi:nucleoside diphosphate kinase